MARVSTFARFVGALMLVPVCDNELDAQKATTPGPKAKTLTPKAQKELLQKAKRWQVPRPHPRSVLVKIWVFQSGKTDFYALGFVEPNKPKRALVGFAYWDATQRSEIKDVPDPDKISLKDVSPTSPFAAVNGVNFGLLTGIQLLWRGHEKLGVALINKALGEESGHPYSSFNSPAGEPPVLMLARSCLAAALNEITSPKPEFPKIKQRIERLLADEPKLKSEATDWVLNGLAATIAHKPAPKGSIERVIDDYLQGCGKEGAMARHVGEFTVAERALILKGFEAVPALLKQRHSKRFTNHVMEGFNNFPSYTMNAGQVINAYLQRIANSELGSNRLLRQKGYTAEDKAVNAWWKAASALGEEAYVKKHAVAIDDENRVTLSHALLLLARERYPAHLSSIYRTLLKTSCPSWPVVEAIMQSKAFPMKRKVELLKAGIATNHEAHRNTALAHLQDLNPPLADVHLLRLLQEAPKTTKGKYWSDQDANLSRCVSGSRDLKVWQALHSLLDRADLGMRMELIHYLMPPDDAPAEILLSFHRIYVRFRDDRTVRDETTSEKFSGPGAGFPHARIAMRDFIHDHWARWLDLKLKSPNRGASQDEWKVYRDTVALAIQKQKSK